MELHSGWRPNAQSLFYSLTFFVLSWNVIELILCTKQGELVQRKKKEMGGTITVDFEYVFCVAK